MIEKYFIALFYPTLFISITISQTTNSSNLTTSSAITTTSQSYRTYSDGAYRLDWIEGIDYIDFVFTTAGQAQENTYSAFGLSLDDQMGNDCVIIIKQTSFNLTRTIYNTLEHYYNPFNNGTGASKNQTLLSYLDSNDKSIGLSNVSVTFVNSRLSVKFRRMKNVNVRNYFNCYNQYYVLFASGAVNSSSGDIMYHTNKLPGVSPVQFCTLTTTSAPTTQQQNPTTTKSSCNTCKHGFSFADFIVGIRNRFIDMLMGFKKYV